MVLQSPFDIGVTADEFVGLPPPPSHNMPRTERYRALVYRIADPEDAEGVLRDIELSGRDYDEAEIKALADKRKFSRTGISLPQPETKPKATIKAPNFLDIVRDEAAEAVDTARKALLYKQSATALTPLLADPAELDRQNMAGSKAAEAERSKAEAKAKIAGGFLEPVSQAVTGALDSGINYAAENIAKGVTEFPLFSTPANGQTTKPVTSGDVARTAYDAYQTDIPYYSAFAREHLQPLAGDVGALAGRVADPLGISGKVLPFSSEEAGRTAGEALTPVTAGDVALELIPGIGLVSDVTKLAPEVARFGRNLADSALRPAIAPEPVVVRLAVRDDAVKPLATDGLAAARGSVEITDPSGVRILGENELPDPDAGESLFFHGTAGEIEGGALRPGSLLTPLLRDANSYARSAAELGKQPAGALRGVLDAVGSGVRQGEEGFARVPGGGDAGMRGNLGGPGVADFTWGTGPEEHKLVWSDGGPWMFGTKDQQGQWIYREVNLPPAKTGQDAYKVARQWVSDVMDEPDIPITSNVAAATTPPAASMREALNTAPVSAGPRAGAGPAERMMGNATLEEQLEASVANPDLIRQRAAETRTIGQTGQARQPVSTPAATGEIRPPAAPEAKIAQLKQDIMAALRGETTPPPLAKGEVLQNIQEGGVVARAQETPGSVMARFRANPANVQKGTLIAALRNLGETPVEGTKAELGEQLRKSVNRQQAQARRAKATVREAQEAVEEVVEQVYSLEGRRKLQEQWLEEAKRLASQEQAPRPVASAAPQTEGATALSPTARSDAVRQASGSPPKRPPDRMRIAGSEYDDMGMASRILDEVGGVLTLPVSLKSMLSPPYLRQGLARLVTSPVQSWRELMTSLKVAANEIGAQKVMADVLEDPWVRKSFGSTRQQQAARFNYEGYTYQDVGGSILDWGDNVPADLRPEELQGLSRSRVGRVVQESRIGQLSNRQAAVELNLHRTNWYRETAKRMWQAGDRDKSHYEALRKTIEHFTQRGSLGQGRVPFFFSLRAQSGRWQAMADVFIQPGNLLKPGARQEAAKALLGMVGANMAFVAGAVYIAEELGIDDVAAETVNKLPTLRIGHNHFDPWAGWNSPAKLIIGLGQDIAERIGEGDLGNAPQDIIASLGERGSRYTTSGFSPLIGQIKAAATGRDFLGNRYNLKDEMLSGRFIKDMVTPFLIEDIIDAYIQDGIVGATLRAPAAFLSMGGSAYGDPFNDAAREAFGKDYGDLTPAEREQVEQDERVIQHREENPSDYQVRKQEVMAPIDAEQAQVEQAFLQGELGESLMERWSKLNIRRDQARVDLGTQFAEQFEDFDQDRFDDAYDGYYDTQVIDPINGEIDFEATEAARDLYLDTLPPDERQWIEEAVAVSFGNQSELRQEYLTYIDQKEQAGYFREDITQAERDELDKANPELDVMNWFFSGGRRDVNPTKLQSIEAVEMALELIGTRGLGNNRGVILDGFTRPVNENEGTMAAWEQYGERAANFLSGVQVEREKERFARIIHGKDAQDAGVWDGQSPLWDILNEKQQAAIESRIREEVRKSTPDLDAYLAWMGRYNTIYRGPNRDEGAIVFLRELRNTYGREPERTDGPIRYKD